ncbi:MAG: hypothetical protein M1817_000896 [Caeruleum heppii]|nr:MAG: hypothetical protein M1817_000896 [Caeruleum heppii]
MAFGSIRAVIGALCILSSGVFVKGDPVSRPDIDIVLNSNPHIGELDRALVASIDQIVTRRRQEDQVLARRDNALEKRDGRVNFCDQRYDEPEYSSWTRGSTEYEPYFTPVFTAPNTSYVFELETGIEDLNAEYAGGCSMSSRYGSDKGAHDATTAEHVYEIQLVANYFEYMATNVSEVRDLLEGDQDPCQEIFCPVLLPTKQWADDADYPDLAQPFDDFRNALSGGADHQNEFIFLEEDVNGLKGRIFNGAYQDPTDSVETDPVENLQRVAQAAMVFNYMNAEKPIASWKAVSDRMLAAAEKLTRATSAPTSTLPAPLQAINWTAGYLAFEAGTLAKVQTTMRNYKNELLDAAETQIVAAKEEAMGAEEVAFWAAYEKSVGEARKEGGRVADEVFVFQGIPGR